MHLFSYDNTTQLKDQLQIIADKQTIAHKNKAYDYIWAKQNIHINIVNDYKSNKTKAINQLIRSMVFFVLFCIATLIGIWQEAWNTHIFENILTPYLLGGFIIAVYMLSSIVFYIFSLQRLNFKRYCYYLNKDYLLILLEDIDKIRVDKIINLTALSVVELDKNGVKIYADTLNPTTIYCDNREEIADFINQQIAKP